MPAAADVLLKSVEFFVPYEINVYFLPRMCHIARLLFQEPSLFAVAKLLETGLVNLSRVHVLWKPVVAQLLEVRHHCHVFTCCGSRSQRSFSRYVIFVKGESIAINIMRFTLTLTVRSRRPKAPDYC